MDQAIFTPTIGYIHTSLALVVDACAWSPKHSLPLTNFHERQCMVGLLSSCTLLYCIRGATTLT
eukprot:5404604-Prymnesium_polylepis.1